jgi:hypothetical protein
MHDATSAIEVIGEALATPVYPGFFVRSWLGRIPQRTITDDAKLITLIVSPTFEQDQLVQVLLGLFLGHPLRQRIILSL